MEIKRNKLQHIVLTDLKVFQLTRKLSDIAWQMYQDLIKFLYNSRGSLFESQYWFELLNKRKLIKNKDLIFQYLEIFNNRQPALNGLINSLYING